MPANDGDAVDYGGQGVAIVAGGGVKIERQYVDGVVVTLGVSRKDHVLHIGRVVAFDITGEYGTVAHAVSFAVRLSLVEFRLVPLETAIEFDAGLQGESCLGRSDVGRFSVRSGVTLDPDFIACFGFQECVCQWDRGGPGETVVTGNR